MKALSIREPWAHMVIHGLKTVEIRSWATDYRGRLAIHAGRKIDEEATRRFDLHGLPAGVLVGTVVLEEVEPFDSASWYALAEEHLDPGPYQPGLYAWRLSDPRPLAEPIPWSGKLGLFDVELDAPEPVATPPDESAAQGLLFDLNGNG